MFLLLPKILMKFDFTCYFSVFILFLLNELSFFTIMMIWFLFDMIKYTLKCGSLQNEIWYYSALVPKYLPSESSTPGPSLVIVVAIGCRSSVHYQYTVYSTLFLMILFCKHPPSEHTANKSWPIPMEYISFYEVNFKTFAKEEIKWKKM